MTKSITTKLIVLLTLCTAAVLSAGLAIDYYFSKNEMLSHLELEAQTSIDTTVENLENWLNNIEGDTLFFSRILEHQEFSKTSLKLMLRDIVDKNDDVFGAAIALNPAVTQEPLGFAPYYYKDKNNELSFSDFASGKKRYWERSWFSEAEKHGKPTWIEPYFDTGGAEVLMTTFSVPVYKRDNAGERFLYAIVTADVALDEIHQYLQHLNLGRNGRGALLSRSGIFLSSADPNDIMQHFLNTDLEEFTIDDSVLNSLFESALAGEQITGKIACPKIPGDCIIRLSALKSTGWPVTIAYSEYEHLAPLREFQTKAVTLGLLALLAMALVVSIITRRLTKPLVALAQVTDKISHGDLDIALPELKGEDEVASLIGAFAAMKTNLKSYIENLETATAARSRLEGELAAAKEIQMAMLPQDGEAWEQTPAFSLWAKTRPAKTVGGDLFTFYQDSNERLFFAVGDVSGKGVPAALFMAKTVSHIQQYSKAFIEPAKGMALLNSALVAGNSNCMFVTLFFGVLDLTTGELRFASAGHTPPCLLRDGLSRTLDQHGDAALGLTLNPQYVENCINLLPGDRLAIYTDGIDEAFNEREQMYTSEPLYREMEQQRGYNIAEVGERVIISLDEFAGNQPQSDDISLMLLQFSQNSPIAKSAPIYGSFSIGPGVSMRVNAWLLEELNLLSLEKAPLMDLLLVSEELTTNIDKHAQLEENDVIEVLLEKSGSDIHLEFRDSGIDFNPLEEKPFTSLEADIEPVGVGGLGIHLIFGLTERQQYRKDGNTNIFRVTKTLE